MRAKLGTACMAAGAALVLAALSLFLWNRWDDSRAGAAAERLLPRLIEGIGASAGEAADPYGPAMTVTEVDGYGCLGCLTLPSLDLELPVLADWDDERLRQAPCRYAGSTKTDDLVIAAHNYRRHFGQLDRLKIGDSVYFTDMDGVMIAYEVAAVDVLAASAVEEMTAGVYDLTLFTCTYDGQDRITVRCERAAE